MIKSTVNLFRIFSVWSKNQVWSLYSIPYLMFRFLKRSSHPFFSLGNIALLPTFIGYLSSAHMQQGMRPKQIDRDSVVRPKARELTREIYDQLNNLSPPKPTGYFTMDGRLDTVAMLLASNGAINLYAAVHGSQLYVATDVARLQRADMLIFVSFPPGQLRNAPFTKSGQVAEWKALLWNRKADNTSGWDDATPEALTSIAVDTVGSVLEGVIDFELLTGTSSGEVYLAVGKYQATDWGMLIGQAPRGNSDGTIDFEEFYELGTGLPFNLDLFNVTVSADRHVHLNWTTLRETNNRGFEVQRKRTSEKKFQTLRNSSVPGHGTTIEPQAYSYTDTTPTLGSWRYRLRQIDLDGSVHFGPEAMVRIRREMK